MTDEEKKAVDKINKLVEYLRKWNDNVTIVPADIKYLEKILDMIKTYTRMIDENIEEILEQSKEIEELKEQCKEVICVPEGTCFMIKSKDTDKKWEDKTKAKIEELDEEIKVKREIAKNPMDRVSGRLLTDSIVELEKTKKVLQSLLEKE